MEYKETFKLTDNNLVETIFLDAVEGLSSSEKLVAKLKIQADEAIIVDEAVEKKKKQL